MAEFNDLTFWTDAILGDTTGLTDAEFGAYTRLLMAAWRRPECDIPDDPGWMRRTAQTPPNQWPRRWAAIEPFWRLTENSHGEPVWVQKKLLKERESRRLFRRKQSAAAQARWDQDRSKKQSTGRDPKLPVTGSKSSLVDPGLSESGGGVPDKQYQALRPGNRICPAHAPESRIPNPVESSGILRPVLRLAHEDEGEVLHTDAGKNGFAPGSYTITDPTQRIARFQSKLAKAIGPEGWTIIFVAMNPSHLSHESALRHCKKVAREQLKKGWPRAWPLDETLHSEPMGAA